MEQREASSQPSKEEPVKWIPQDDPVEEWPIVDADVGARSLDEEVPQADEGRIGSGFFQRPAEDDWKQTLIGKDLNGKEIIVRKRLEGIGYEIIYGHSQAKKPRELDGMFTSYSIAEREARLFIAKQRDNAKISSN